MAGPRRGRKSPADHKREINAAFRFLAGTGVNPRASELLGMQRKVREYAPRAPANRLEARIVAEIHTALLKHPRVARVRRRQVGTFQDGNRWISVGRKGDPDFEGMLHGGQAFGIEVKRPGEEPMEHQQRRLDEITAGGGRAGCAHSVEEALAIIETYP